MTIDYVESSVDALHKDGTQYSAFRNRANQGVIAPMCWELMRHTLWYSANAMEWKLSISEELRMHGDASEGRRTYTRWHSKSSESMQVHSLGFFCYGSSVIALDVTSLADALA